jgi:tetratricopeptide (TPR) repeat protein
MIESQAGAMADKCYSNWVYLMVCVLPISLSGCGLGTVPYQAGVPKTDMRLLRSETKDCNERRNIMLQTTPEFAALKHLPAGARINRPDEDVVVADLDGDGRQAVVVFYTLGSTSGDNKACILVLKQSDADYVQIWEKGYDDASGFAAPTGVYDLNNNSKLEIVAYRTIGASCPGVLEIYEYRNGKIGRITGEWADKGQCGAAEIKDLNDDSVPEVIILGHHGGNDDIYHWTGREYVRSNSRFPQYFNNRLEDLLRAIHSVEALPSSARIVWSKQAVEIYILQRRYSEAIHLCEEVLQMIDDPALTSSDVYIKEGLTPEEVNRTLLSFDIGKIEAKASIYSLLGDSYKAAGDLQEAQEKYQRARQFEAEAKSNRSKLTH